jgi:hypothetical protein
MGDLAIGTIFVLAVMVGFPIMMVAIYRKHPPSSYPLSPNVERRRFLLALFVGEAFFALMGYPLVVDLLIGARNFLDMPNNPNVPSWALPVAYIWGGVVVAATMTLLAMELYGSYRAFKLRRAEQQAAPD